MRFLGRLSLVAFVLLGSTAVATADPLLVTGGAIQIYPGGAYFSRITTTGGDFTGDTEGTPIVPLFSNLPGSVVPISSSAENQLTGFSVWSPTRRDIAGAVNFHFTTRNVTLPAASEAMGAGASVFAPFTFTGTLTAWASYPEMFAGATPLFEHALSGSGMAEARFFTQQRDGQPTLVAYGAIYRFGPQPPTPTPEPGTIALLAGGVAAVIARRRRRA